MKEVATTDTVRLTDTDLFWNLNLKWYTRLTFISKSYIIFIVSSIKNQYYWTEWKIEDLTYVIFSL